MLSNTSPKIKKINFAIYFKGVIFDLSKNI